MILRINAYDQSVAGPGRELYILRRVIGTAGSNGNNTSAMRNEAGDVFDDSDNDNTAIRTYQFKPSTVVEVVFKT